ncbi:MAG: hypothetical protein MJE66_17060 [Proteobacteria bacterium]|nr:hypothetical protein [Pseudomonadota bacterium]
MRRRFGRRRRGGTGSAPIDAERWLQRVVETGAVPVSSLEATQEPGVGADYAVLGTGTREAGEAVLVAVAPHRGGDALLAALAAATRRQAEEGFSGEVVAAAPQWSIAARRRLGLVGELDFAFRAAVVPAVGDAVAAVEPEAPDEAPVVAPSRVAAHLARPRDRALFERAAAALEGLASKHGGAVRGIGRSVELVVMARRVAELRADEGGVELRTFLPQRSTLRLSDEGLAGALDRLEGNLRKRLGDRKTRDGEDGLRSRSLSELVAAQSLRAVVPWPLGGRDRDAVDFVAVDAEGRPVVGATRATLGLSDLGEILDAAVALRPALPTLLAGADAPVRLEAPRLLLAAQTVDASVRHVLSRVVLAHELVALSEGAGGVQLETLGTGAAAPAPRPSRRRRPAAPSEEPAEVDDAEAEGEQDGAASPGDRAPRRRGRGRRGRGRRPSEAAPEDRPAEAEAPAAGGYEELSLFDLDDEPAREAGDDSEAEEEAGGARRGRRRSRRRRGGRRRGGEGDDAAELSDEGDGPSGEDADSDEAREGGRRRRGRGGRRRPSASATSASDDDVELPETLAPLAEGVPELQETPPALDYEDEEEGSEDADPGHDRWVRERERRRQERSTGREAETVRNEAAAPAATPRAPRRRAALLLHGDRSSILAGVLLARDLRLVEGIWIYPQAELMTFFRSVATDLREDTPIYVVGFTPSPAHDVLQAASLYRNRLFWYDHHDWPPEDLAALQSSLGEDALHRTPGTGTSLTAVLGTSTRRSRFSDKLVDLAAGRFSQHDYERWGRLWWSRLGELAAESGERRASIEPLLVGRPSELAKEAGKADTPPLPPELAYVSERDFRLVHFGGFVLVVVAVPTGLDAPLAARIARERYSAQLSLTVDEASGRIELGAEEASGKRTFDLGGLADHLAQKLEWVDVLPDDDHVARVRVRGLASHPDRLDDVIGEVAMGRSLLEG